MFTKATKQESKLRMAIFAPSGGGKTFTALKFAAAIGQKIAYIDTENMSSTKYLGVKGMPEYDICDLTYNGSASRYVNELITAIKQAETQYDVLVIDSLTHAWTATKDEVDAVAARMKTQNSFAAWRDGTTLWGKLIAAILSCKCHLICCARSKTEYVQEKIDGRTVINKIGLAPELRDGMEYEFDIVCDIDHKHNLVVTKTRCADVDGTVVSKPAGDFLVPIVAWLAGDKPKAYPPIDATLETISLCMKAEDLRFIWENADKVYPNVPACANERKRIKDAINEMKKKLGLTNE